MQTSGGVVVGLPPTPDQDHVLNWAAIEARRSGVHLLVVRCTDDGRPDPVLPDIRRRYADLTVESVVSTGRPDEELLKYAEVGRLLVVGAPRPDTGLSHLIAASTASNVAFRARCPVVVVPRCVDEVRHDRLVVGVNGSAAATTALHSAFLEARRRNARLLVVGGKEGRTSGAVDAVERQVLGLELQAWIATFPGVPVDYEIRHGRPADVLLAAAASADLLLIGERDHRGFLGIHNASITPALLSRSPCPVLVARSRPEPPRQAL
ncbi:MAG TPA: universal stress protein [Mycobacteriales bacterium]|nr:universal stress protein [Mycobacteriales bacterium]